MSWIQQIDEADASGALADIYAQLLAERGKVANILKVHSLRPQAMHDHLALYMGLLFGPGALSRRQRELIAVCVSQTNRCAYCAAHHLQALARYERNAARFAAIEACALEADLDAADRALLRYAAKLTAAPQEMHQGEVVALRAAGFDDESILLAALITAYFNFVNRIALGLGVAHSADEVAGYRV